MLIFSLTTIPPRFPFLNQTLQSLLKQTKKANRIILNIPRNYRRFTLDTNAMPKLPNGIDINIIDVDYGPATKILPTVQMFKGENVTIIFCDDDRIYDPEWAGRFIECSKQRPDDCIVEAGWEISQLSDHNYEPTNQPRAVPQPHPRNYFEKKKRKLLRDRRLLKSSGYVDVLGGCCGVLVKPDFFDKLSFDIPDYIWTVDDVWLSGCLARRDIGIWANSLGRDAVRSCADGESALFDFSLENVGRHEANHLAIDYFRNEYSIWTDPPIKSS